MRYAVLGSPKNDVGLLFSIGDIVKVDVILSCDGGFISNINNEVLRHKQLPIPVVTIVGKQTYSMIWEPLVDKTDYIFNLCALANGIILPIEEDIIAGIGGIYDEEVYQEQKKSPTINRKHSFMFNYEDVGFVKLYGRKNPIDIFLSYEMPDVSVVKGGNWALGEVADELKCRYYCFFTGSDGFIFSRITKPEHVDTWLIGLPDTKYGFCTLEPAIPRVCFFTRDERRKHYDLAYIRHIV